MKQLIVGLSLTAVLATTNAGAQSVCAISGDYSGDPDKFAEIAARHLIVGITAQFQSSATSYGGTGSGFIVAAIHHQRVVRTLHKTELYDPCAERELLVFTALHVVLANGVEFAEHIGVRVADAAAPVEAKLDSYSVLHDIAILRVPIPHEVAWTGFRRSAEIEPQEEFEFGELRDGIRFSKVRAHLDPQSATVALSNDIDDGLSGTPLFDSNWNVVGMVTNKERNTSGPGFAVSTEMLELFLAASGHSENLPTVAELQRDLVQQRLRRTFDKPRIQFLYGIGVLGRVNVPRLGRFGISSGVPIARLGQLGFEAQFGASVVGGDPTSGVFAELGADIGFGMFVCPERYFAVSGRWSPSAVVVHDNVAKPFLALPAFAFGVETGKDRVHLGVDYRGVSRPGDHASFAEWVAYLAWMRD